jgi:molybdopterin/thiamine biosynthesis adenylyltransferase
MSGDVLVFPESEYDRLILHFRGVSDERMAFAYCGVANLPTGRELLVRAIDLPEDSEYRIQKGGFVSLKAERVLPRVTRAREYSAFVDAHSHPFADRPVPSGIDEAGAIRQARLLRDLAPGACLVRLVFSGTDRVWAEHTYAEFIRWEPFDAIIVLGPCGRRVVRPVNAHESNPRLTAPHESRTLAVVGSQTAAAQLRSAAVAVIGLGGVGSAVAKLLAGYVGHVLLIDPDSVEVHNAPRLHFYTDGDCGRSKAEVASREIARAFPRTRVDTFIAVFPSDQTIEACKQADFIFCCPDHNAVRYSAAQVAARYLKPLVEVGCGGRRLDGRISALGYHVRLQYPGGPCLACNGLDLRALEDPSTTDEKHRLGYLEDGQVIPGELVSLTTRAAADAAEIFFRYMTGYAGPVPAHLYFDALNFLSVDASSAFAHRNGCSICGTDEVLQGAGDCVVGEQRILACTGGDDAVV